MPKAPASLVRSMELRSFAMDPFLQRHSSEAATDVPSTAVNTWHQVPKRRRGALKSRWGLEF